MVTGSSATAHPFPRYTAGMSTPAVLQRRIAHIKAELTALGPLRPGTLSQQYNVCGTPGCRCKDDPPHKHGPYSQLSYTWRARSRSEFVRAEEIGQLEQQLRTYARLRTLIDQWIDAAIELARLERQERRRPPSLLQPNPRVSRNTRGRRPES
jgi:Family of unknown function (DUF6788)